MLKGLRDNMTQFQAEEKTRLRRGHTREAIALAMQGRWSEAVDANRNIIEMFPTDVNAYNRLGKALTELGQYTEAKAAYRRAREIDPSNSIARKNLRRLACLDGIHPQCKDKLKVAPHLFIEETGKTGQTTLIKVAVPEILAKMAAGDKVNLKVAGQSLTVENAAGEYLGEVEPKLGLRLIKLTEGGNLYNAAIASAEDSKVRVIIREVFQHHSQAGRPSFISRAADKFRAYVKNSVLKYELEDEEGTERIGAEWEEGEEEEEEETLPRGMSLVETSNDLVEQDEEPERE